jgi:hypothetical protein
MGMMKQYLLGLLHQCSEEQFGQDAIEWAIVSGLVHLTYDLERDSHAIMSRYDEIIEGYRRSIAEATETRPMPIAPMERAASHRRRVKTANPSVKKRKAG